MAISVRFQPIRRSGVTASHYTGNTRPSFHSDVAVCRTSFHGDNNQVGEGSIIEGSFLRNVHVGAGVRIVNSVIESPNPDHPIVVGNKAMVVSCPRLFQEPGGESFSFWRFRVDGNDMFVGIGAQLVGVTATNMAFGAGNLAVQGGYFEYGISEDGVVFRRGTNLTRSFVGARANVGSEMSKTIILGVGFVSEHGNSYLSLVAPNTLPIIGEGGEERVLAGIPNLTNIGSGTVCANYGGGAVPAESLSQIKKSEKGTSVFWTGFTGINAKVINLYGQPNGEVTDHDLFRRNDVTVVSFGAFVLGMGWGVIPPFTRAEELSPRSHQLGWGLANNPAMVINFAHKIQKACDPAVRPLLREVVPGSIRWAIRLLEEERDEKISRRHTPEQITAGIALYRTELESGKWELFDNNGDWNPNSRWTDRNGKWVWV